MRCIVLFCFLFACAPSFAAADEFSVCDSIVVFGFQNNEFTFSPRDVNGYVFQYINASERRVKIRTLIKDSHSRFQGPYLIPAHQDYIKMQRDQGFLKDDDSLHFDLSIGDPVEVLVKPTFGSEKYEGNLIVEVFEDGEASRDSELLCRKVMTLSVLEN